MLVRFCGRNVAAGLVSATRMGKPAELGRLPAGLFRNRGGEREKWVAGREKFRQPFARTARRGKGEALVRRPAT